MPLRIRIKNLNKKRGINKRNIKKAVLYVFRKFKKEDALLDITFVTNSRIRALNKRYMGRNKTTDVLSFSLEEKAFSGAPAIIGDVYISSDMAGENRKRFKTHLRKELTLYVMHGLLHLLGFGDRPGPEKKKMRKLEEKLMNEFEGKNG